MTIHLYRILGIPLICLACSGCNEKRLFEAPSRGASAAPPPAVTDSVITLVAFLPYDSITEAAETKIPKTVSIGGDGSVARMGIPYINPGHVGSHQSCFDKPYVDFRGVGMERACINVPDIYGPSIGMKDQSADYHWHATVDKDGALRISNSGEDILVKQNIHVSGQAGVGGDLAHALSLSGKNFDVRVTSKLLANVGLDDHWCPLVNVEPVGRWIDTASVEVVGKNCVGFDFGKIGHPQVCAGPINLGLADVLNREFDNHRDDIKNAAQKILPCEKLRALASSQWHPFSIKVDRAGQAPLFLNIEPKSAAFSGLIPGDKAIKATIRVGASTILSTSADVNMSSGLPALERVSANEGALDVNLQALAPYDFLRNELKATIKGRTFKEEIPGGSVKIYISDVDIYPSSDSIAIGLKIEAATPRSWFNTVGWVYLTGKPVPAPDGKAVAIEDLKFSTVIDNRFWQTVQLVFERQVLSDLKRQSTFDLSPFIKKASSQISTAIANFHMKGVKISAGEPNIRLSNMYVSANNLVTGAQLKLSFETQVTADIIK